MIRYVRQHNDYECAPIGAANALKWAGVRFSYSKVRRMYMEVFKCVPGEGSYRLPVANSLRYWSGGKLKTQFVAKPRIAIVDRHLRNGGAVLMAFATGGDKIEEGISEGHVSLCVGKNEEGDYLLVNHIGFTTMIEWPRAAMLRNLRRRRGYPFIWLLRKD